MYYALKFVKLLSFALLMFCFLFLPMSFKLCQRTSKRFESYFVKAFAIDMGQCI